MGPLTFIGPFVGSWTAPPGVYSVFVECHGGGGSGGNGGGTGGDGGGGGGYASAIVPVIPGNTYAIVAAGTGGMSSFDGAIVQGYGATDVNGVGGFVDTENPATLVQIIYGGNGGTTVGLCGAAGGGGAKGGSGGTGGDCDPDPTTPGNPGGFPGGGGGGGGTDGETGAGSGAGGVGYLKIRSVFGYGGYHQTHSSGQTNSSIPHDLPLNQWTSTKISIRRKSAFSIALSLPPYPPVCNIPYRTLNVADVNFPGNTLLNVAVPRGIQTAIAYCYGRGGAGSESGEGGGCGGFAAGVMDVAGDTSIPANITGSASTGTVSADGGGTPDGGDNNIGDYTSNGGNGGATIWLDVVNYSGGDGCGGALGGDGYGDTTGQNATGIGQGGGGAGGSTEIAGTPGNGGPGFIQITLCSRLGFLHRMHQRHDTGQTNDSIPHDTPLNLITTTKGIGLRRRFFAGLAGPYPPIPTPLPAIQPCSDPEYDLIINGHQNFNIETFANSESFNWVAPYGVTEIILQVQGSGGGGAQGGDDAGGCGGSGGSCAYYIVAVIPGQNYPILIDPITGTIDFNTGEITVSGDIEPATGPTCELFFGSPGGEPECPGSGGYGGAGGSTYGVPGSDGALGGGGGGGGPGASGGYGGYGWMRIFYVNQFGFISGGSGGTSNHYVSPTHQTHQTGQTNSSIPHCVPMNQWTTAKGMSVRNKRFVASVLALAPNEFETLTCARVVTPAFYTTNGTFTVPNSVCQILVECQGDGQDGGNGDGGSDGVGGAGGNGGHGGGYGSSILTVTPGTTYFIEISPGVESAFLSAPFVYVVAGYSGQVGGGGLGTTVYNGNAGGLGQPGYPQVGDVSGNGGNGGAGGTSGYNSAGGAGGLGEIYLATPPTAGQPGYNYGGGGGGGGGADGASSPGALGGLGGPGFVRIRWHSIYGLTSPRLCEGED